MTHDDHEHDHHDHLHHGHEHHEHGHDHHQAHRPKALHKDWRAWVAVGLMLAAMLAYVLTMDESLQPGALPEPTMPADAAP